jgi:hypothetical protein
MAECKVTVPNCAVACRYSLITVTFPQSLGALDTTTVGSVAIFSVRNAGKSE